MDLPCIEQIVPDTVAASGDGRSWIHETAAQPDGEYRVLLAERLSGRNAVSKSFSNGFSCPELKGAADKRNQGDSQQSAQTDGSMCHALRRDAHGDGQGYSPKIKGQIAYLIDSVGDFSEESPENPGCCHRGDKQRESARHDDGGQTAERIMLCVAE